MTVARLVTVFAKELVDNLRDRRTLATAILLGPLLGPLMFVFSMRMVVERAVSDVDTPLALPVVGAEHAPNLVAWLEENGVEIRLAPAEPRAAVAAGEARVVLVIPPHYPDDFRAGRPARVELVSDQSDKESSKDARRAERLLEQYGRRLAVLRLAARGVDPAVIAPVLVEDVDVSTPEKRALLLLNMIPFFLLMAALFGGFYLAIDSTAGERERGSLEPLLSTAATRAELVLGKLLAVTVFSAASLALTLAAYALSARFMPLEQLGMSANLGFGVLAAMFAIMLPFVLLVSALLVVVASFTKSYKEAQTYLSFVTLLPMIPLFATLAGADKPVLWMMALPTLSQHLLMLEFMRGSATNALFLAVSVGVTTLLAALLAWLAVRLYSSERILG